MNKRDDRKRAHAARQWQIEKERIEQRIRSIRLGEGPYTAEMKFEERLTRWDREMLREMGIAV